MMRQSTISTDKFSSKDLLAFCTTEFEFSDGFNKGYKPVERKPGDPTGQLYNMEEDPGETNNLILENPEVAGRLAVELDRIVKDDHTRPY